MEILFLLVGLVFVAIGVAVVVGEVRARLGASEVSGEVIGFSTGKSGATGAGTYHTVAAYPGLDGRKRFVESSVGSSVPLAEVGDGVIVLAHPDTPEEAVIKSSGTFALGAALALMGLVPCVIFFVTFRPTAFSIGSAVAVVGWAAYKLFGSARKEPGALQAWRESKREAFRTRVFTEETRAGIRWGDPVAMQAATANMRRTNRFAVPVMLLAGVGVFVFGVHLHRKTDRFLAHAVRAPGIVVQMVANASSDGTTYAPVVEFAHAGSRYRFKDPVSSSPPSHRTGDAVAVLYDPDRPPDARIDRGRWNRLIPILIGGSGLLLFVLGLWTLERRAGGKAW